MGIEILENILVVRTNKTSRNEVLLDLSEAAIREGYAKKGYYEALIEREDNFPTGLHLEKMDVAIPHAEAEWAIKSSVTIGVLENSVEFEPMGGFGDPVLAELIFLLTIKDPKEHIDFLRVFTTLLSESDLLTTLKQTGNPEPIVEMLKSGMPDRS